MDFLTFLLHHKFDTHKYYILTSLLSKSEFKQNPSNIEIVLYFNHEIDLSMIDEVINFCKSNVQQSILWKIKPLFKLDDSIATFQKYFEHSLKHQIIKNLHPSLPLIFHAPTEKIIKKGYDFLITTTSNVKLRNYELCSQTLQKLINAYGFTVKKLSFKNNIVDFFNQPAIINLQKPIIEQVTNFDVIKPPARHQNLKFNDEITTMVALQNEMLINNWARVQGFIFNKNIIKWATGRTPLLQLFISDYTNVTFVELLSRDNNLFNDLKLKQWIDVVGIIKFDDFHKCNKIFLSRMIDLKTITEPEQYKIFDNEINKRVELHVHTKNSALDGVNSVSEYIEQAALWNHKAIAITDHYNVQSFPEASLAHENFPDLKIIYGVEMDMIEDTIDVVINVQDRQQNLFTSKLAFLDIETTGLIPNHDEIIELAIQVVQMSEDNPYKVIRTYNHLFKSNTSLKININNLTGITDEMLANKPFIKEELLNISKTLEGCILVAHNAPFDFNFLKNVFLENNCLFNFEIIDTLWLARFLFPDNKKFKLADVARYLDIEHNKVIAHRADADVWTLKNVFLKMLPLLKDKNILTLDNLMIAVNQSQKRLLPFIWGSHITVLVKNQAGLKDLYKLVSLSHVDYFFKNPKITRSLINQFRTNLLIGSACQNGELFKAIQQDPTKIDQLIDWYDYIEVQPLLCYENLIWDETLTSPFIKKHIKDLIITCDKKNKLVVATGDVHYLHNWHAQVRDVLIFNKGLKGINHPLFKTCEKKQNGPIQNFKTTKAMLDEFAFLNDTNLIQKIVVDNTNAIADQIEIIQPLKKDFFVIKLDNEEENLNTLCAVKVLEKYGNKLHAIVSNRISTELNIILKNGFSAIYLTAHEIVTKSLKKGFLVGSRGSIGSSLVAYLLNITEVNPLPKHYLCSNCKFINFDNISPDIKSGFDLQHLSCPNCNIDLLTDGHDIPFETFFGLTGDKIPDIDLNFSGDYQLEAHNHLKTQFGADKVFRTGTISTIASRTAFAMIKKHFELIKQKVSNIYIEYLIFNCVGIKRTTGQHPGGIMIVPPDNDILDFTPYHFPADDTSSLWKTTHFDYSSIQKNLFKFDILGHDDPTALKLLHEYTGRDPLDIPFHDSKVLSLFSSVKSLKLEDRIAKEVIGTIGVPEFGTPFARKTLKTLKPKTFFELVQISGLAHGKNIWTDNAQVLWTTGKPEWTLNNIVACRDDIMNFLVFHKIDRKLAFDIMESIRKGHGLSQMWKKQLIDNGISTEHIDFFNKITYMFPKAHAIAYVIMACRIAWYKLHYPEEHYATFFSIRSGFFDLSIVQNGKQAIHEALEMLKHNKKKSTLQQTAKDKGLFEVFEVALEMFERNIIFSGISLSDSDAINFKVIFNADQKKEIIAPFLAVDGLGKVVANAIVNARKNKSFSSLEDFQNRTSINQSQLKKLQDMGVLRF